MLVSKDWCLSAYPLIWHRPSFTNMQKYCRFLSVLNSVPEDLALPYSMSIRRINLSSMASTLRDHLLYPLMACKRVERLALPNAEKVSSAALAAVVGCMPDLLAVDLSGCAMLDDQVLRTLAEKCPRVQGLNLTGCKRVGDGGMQAIAAKHQGLRRVSLFPRSKSQMMDADRLSSS